MQGNTRHSAITKVQKNPQEDCKKVLTTGGRFGNIVKRLAGDREREARLNLENDTEQRNAKRQTILMSEGLLREQEIRKGLNGRV